MARELVLGIDFGSSTTIAGALVGDRIELVQDAGDHVIPSVAYVPDRGGIEIGRRAAARQWTDPSRVVRSVKRLLGQPSSAELVRRYAAGVPFQVDLTGDRPVLKLTHSIVPEQVAAAVLAHVRDLAEKRFGATPRKAVVTLSADAPPGYREAIVRAARIAHLEILELVAEPIAGTLALDLHMASVHRRVVVCDFGGGTFDVSAVLQEGLRFRPIATYGDHFLGGDDLDDVLAEAIAAVVMRNSGYDLHKDIVRWNELVLRCESAKRQLSDGAHAPLAMRDAYLQGGVRKDLKLTLEESWAAAAWNQKLTRAREVIVELLRRAGWHPQDVDVIGLVGGGSLVPAFQRSVRDLFPPDRVTLAYAPELAVAQGATLLTARYRSASQALPTLVASA